MKKDTYTYELDGNLYVNLTNSCSNDCTFCVRNEKTSYYGHELWLSKKPTANDVIENFPKKQYNEVVFCGFGEPTFALDVMLEVATYVKSLGYTTRLNTNGHGNIINKKNIAPLLKDKIDLVNISLNSYNASKYNEVCRCKFGEAGFNYMLEFASECKKANVNAIFSIVDCIGETDIENCKKVASECGLPIKIREMIEDS